MSLVAEGHVKELGPGGKLGHRGLTGSWPTDRVNRYGAWKEALGEAIYYGRDDAREVVMALIMTTVCLVVATDTTSSVPLFVL